MAEQSKISRKLFRKNYKVLLISLLIPMLLLSATVAGAQIMQYEQEYASSRKSCMDAAEYYLDSAWDAFYNVSSSSLLKRNLAALTASDRSQLTASMLQNISALQGYLDMAARSGAITDVYLYIDNPAYVISRSAAWQRPNAPYIFPGVRAYIYGFAERVIASGESSLWALHEGNIYYGRLVCDLYQQPAYIITYCSNTALASRLNSMLRSRGQQRNRLLIADETGLIMHDSDMLAIGQTLDDVASELEGGMYDSLVRTSGLQNWKYILLTERQGLINYRWFVVGTTFALLLAVFLLCAWVAHRLTSILCKPYDIITDLLRTPVEDAAERYGAEYAPHDELGMIHTLIYQTKYALFTTQNELTQSRLAFQNAQNTALQSQINPHFLYNTLETINWRVYEKLPNDFEISGMIQKLSLLFRLSLESNESLVPLSRELLHVQAYLDIQHERYKNAFQETWDIDNDVLESRVVRLSLQPIFENAILYGVREVEHGRIYMRARRLDDGSEPGGRLLITITDNGPGLSPEAVARLNERLHDSRGAASDHIGLLNVNTRIQLIYGVEYGLTVSSAPYSETTITMLLPYNTTQRSAPWENIS